MHPFTFLAPLLPLLPLALANPLAFPFADAQATTDNPSRICPCYPDFASDTYRGYQGTFKAVGFPSSIGCPGQGAQVNEGRIEDTVRRGLGAFPVSPPANLGDCAGLNLPIHQGTVYIGNVQIFVAWDDVNKVAQWCSVETPENDCRLTFAVPKCQR